MVGSIKVIFFAAAGLFLFGGVWYERVLLGRPADYREVVAVVMGSGHFYLLPPHHFVRGGHHHSDLVGGWCLPVRTLPYYHT